MSISDCRLKSASRRCWCIQTKARAAAIASLVALVWYAWFTVSRQAVASASNENDCGVSIARRVHIAWNGTLAKWCLSGNISINMSCTDLNATRRRHSYHGLPFSTIRCTACKPRCIKLIALTRISPGTSCLRVYILR